MGLLDGTTQQQYYLENDHGSYQFTSLDDIITQFQIAYVGEDKIISKVRRADIVFHAQRALQELSFDTFKSIKAQEIKVPASLQMTLPQDYVNYTKVSWIDSAGIKHLLYPTNDTSNPTSIIQDATNGLYSPIASGFHANLSTDDSNISYGANVLRNTTTNQVDFTAAETFNKLDWSNVNPRVGRFYTVTYTVSNVPYRDPSLTSAAPSIFARINDEFGSYMNFFSHIDNGTYTETKFFEGGSSLSTIHASRFYLEVSGTFTGSISNVTLVESADTPTNLESAAWSKSKSTTTPENKGDAYDDNYWPMNGSRYGLDTQRAQANGTFYMDNLSGKIHFSSNISGRTVILDYISDSLGTDGEMQVHKFAEEAMYKCIAYAILSTRANVQEYIVQRFKKERFAAIRTAKLRILSIKPEELTQILRGKSKQIKH